MYVCMYVCVYGLMNCTEGFIAGSLGGGREREGEGVYLCIKKKKTVYCPSGTRIHQVIVL